METSKKIIRAKVQLQNEKPFFAYLIMNMKFREEEQVSTIGVDKNGNCVYNPKFIDTLSEDELKGVLAHEVLHLVLEHLTRGDKLKHRLYNISADLCINDILKTNGFELARGGLIPDRYHEYDFQNSEGKTISISHIDEKTAEMVYAELLKHLKDDDEATGKENNKRFDEHIDSDGEGDGEGDSEGGEPINKELSQGIKDKWKKAVSEASAYARQKGNMPEGLGIFVDSLLNEKVNWKQLLYKYLTRTIPFDYSYSRPSKRSFSTGVYMPIMRKEAIEIVVSLDTSGSIQKEELTAFMSEINGIARSFNNLSMKLIVCDSTIKDVYDVGNGDADELSKLKIRGGGGTSHKPIYDYVNENLPNTKLLVNFTDGYTDLDELDQTINTLWVLCKDGVSESRIPFGEVIKLN